jgi:hypothetical protein
MTSATALSREAGAVPHPRNGGAPPARRQAITCTPFQNATRPVISAAAGFGSG